MDISEPIYWTRIFHHGKCVGAVEGDALTTQWRFTREELRAGYSSRVGVWHKRPDGSLRFDCGNTLDCDDIHCCVWH